MNDTEILVIIFLCILPPVLILVFAVFVIYYGIQNAEQQEEKPIPSKTDYCKLHKQFCDMDIILSRYEHANVLGVTCFNYHLFKLETGLIFDTLNEMEAFFEKYPDMKQRYQCLEYFLWRISSHR